MPFDPVVVALQMMVPAEAAATNQVSAVSYFFISPSAEKTNPVKNPVDRRVEPPGGTFADRAAFAADGAYNRNSGWIFKRECDHRKPRSITKEGSCCRSPTNRKQSWPKPKASTISFPVARFVVRASHLPPKS